MPEFDQSRTGVVSVVAVPAFASSSDLLARKLDRGQEERPKGSGAKLRPFFER